jgi:hypothetical protein
MNLTLDDDLTQVLTKNVFYLNIFISRKYRLLYLSKISINISITSQFVFQSSQFNQCWRITLLTTRHILVTIL